MRCNKCGQRYFLGGTFMGGIDAPGWYFLIAVGFGLFTAYGVYLLVGGVSRAGMIITVWGGLVTLLSLYVSIVGRGDHFACSPPSCPSCGEEVKRIRPWTI